MEGNRVVRAALLLFLLASLFFAVPGSAQKITGDITGTVTDSTGAVIKDAKITATNRDTGETRSATSSDAGFYRIVELPPGKYKVTVMLEGFKSATREAEVAIAAVTLSDFKLEPGQVNETVQVEGVAPLVETTEDRLSTIFQSQQVADLPNSGRDFNNLLDGIPGVQRTPGGGYGSLNINGQRATSNNFAVDGIPNNDRYYGEASFGQAAITGTASALIPLDGISEFNVESNPSVEFGISGGSVINIGLKSGTNQLHGSAFWDRHTDVFDARNYFSPQVNPFRLNQFGASGGFPIKKDKAFVYLSYQGFHLKSVVPSQVTLPTPAEIFDAKQCVTTAVNPNTSGEGPFDGSGNPICLNNIPGPGSDQIYGTADDGTINSIGANMLSFIPTSPTGIANVAANNALDNNNFHVKFDYIFNQSNRVSVKYLFGDSLQNQPPAAGVPQSVGPLASNPNLWNSVAPVRAQLAGVNYTWTITPTKVLESRLGYTRFSERIGVNNNIDPNALGLNTGPLGASPSDKENFGVPVIYYLGYFGNTSGYSLAGGIQGYPIITRPDATYDWQEHFTAIKGNHTIKLGGQYQNAYTKSRRDRARSDLSFYSYGFYYCAYATTCNPAFASVGQSNHVAALNELLLGLTDGSSRVFGVTDRRISQKALGLYVQDSWKVKPSFTLELGVRWDIASALGEAQDQGSNFLPDDPKAATSGPNVGFVTLSQQPLYKKDKNNFGPRVGFAWDLYKNGKVVLRGGYSLNYDLPIFSTLHAPQTFITAWSGAKSGFFTQVPEGNSAVSVFENTPDSNKTIFNGGTQPNDLCNFFVCLAPGVNIYGDQTALTPSVVQVVRNFQTPMNHAYNLTLEEELRHNLSISIAYVGTAGRDLVNWRDLNACPISPDACTPDRQPLTALFHDSTGAPLYNHVLQLNNDGYSNYNSLQTSMKVRDLHGLTGQANFVWSRALDTGSANRGYDFLSEYQNPYSVAKNYAPSDFDTPWNANFTAVYAVPRLYSLPKLVGDGWQLNSIFRAQKGRPLTAYVRGDPSGQGLATTYANYDGTPLDYDLRNPNRLFNVAGFSLPDPGTVGTAGRNSLRAPGISQLDMSVFKSFKFSERYTVMFKWEVFNVLNHSMFATGTGKITTCSLNANSHAIPGTCAGGFGTSTDTPDVGNALNPVLGGGAARNMNFGIEVKF